MEKKVEETNNNYSRLKVRYYELERTITENKMTANKIREDEILYIEQEMDNIKGIIERSSKR